MVAAYAHTPVLLDETLAALDVRSDGVYVDATFGRGGHTAALLLRLGLSGRVIGLDRDPAAIAAGRERFSNETRLTLLHTAFGDIAKVVRAALGETSPGNERSKGAITAASHANISGVLFDLGVSSPQLDDASRGFSFMQDGPLDMRMDNSAGVTAAQWIASASERDVAQVIRDYGEERFANRIARAIVGARKTVQIDTTAKLSAIVADAVPTREPGKNPATRTFQAIRIHINREFEQIERALAQSLEILAPGGRLCVISFHSLEDRIVKQFMQRHSQEDPVYAGLPDVPAHARPKLKRVGRAIHPSDDEVARNPRSRSAILRVAERVAA